MYLKNAEWVGNHRENDSSDSSTLGISETTLKISCDVTNKETTEQATIKASLLIEGSEFLGDAFGTLF